MLMENDFDFAIYHVKTLIEHLKKDFRETLNHREIGSLTATMPDWKYAELILLNEKLIELYKEMRDAPTR